MTEPTHIVQSNGFSRMPLIDTLRPFEEQLRFTLNRMDGATLWAYSLWRAPEGASLRASLPFSDEYLQSAATGRR
ncbi:hypothetical protein [Microbacterium dauci]|uniref:Uncharacterized protein n=1 Tax=Microbacterium dauci TaxID=3048008 RepID=A0ABT6ZF45_9MICO|nr:hypothetical protein [Microbacterium sp. LX3-4]MDJ1114601.1 hypothetical protein [Microbacterium sp. LX3-4]